MPEEVKEKKAVAKDKVTKIVMPEELTIDEAVRFFEEGEKVPAAVNRIISRLKPLQDVGLGYLRMGQSSSTLSGGEAQRIKLAFFLSRGGNEAPTLFIFDEPTTGLHFHDIHNLLNAFYALLEHGHSVLIIEHNQEVIRAADWIVDMGPEGGEKGGQIVAGGTPEKIAETGKSHTGKFLRKALKK